MPPVDRHRPSYKDKSPAGGAGDRDKNGQMAKYDPLYRYLRRRRPSDCELSFSDIERFIGGMLPGSAAQPQWWAKAIDHAPRQVQRKAWADAGYDACLIVGRERVRFTRAV